MKVSRYLTFSRYPLLDEDGALVRVAFHAASGQIYVLLQELARALAEEPDSLPRDVVADLAEAGLLVAEGTDEFSSVVSENAASLREERHRRFVLMPSSYCNMGCDYCGQSHFKSAQSGEHRAAVISRITAAACHPATSAVEISWFGAEPMMGYRQILDISAAAIAVCDSEKTPYSASMTTNGSLLTLDKLRRLYHDCRVGKFEITLDGVEGTHDESRKLKNGRSNFQRTVRFLQEASTAEDLDGLQIHIRTNVSRRNQDQHREFAATMAAAGLANPRVAFYAAPVRSWGKDVNDVSDVAVADDQLALVDQDWIRAYLDHGLTTEIVYTARKKRVCAAVSKLTEVIDPAGRIHSCTEQPLVPGREDTALGNVVDLPAPQLRPRGLYDDFNADLLHGRTTAYCPTCSIFPICGGACPQSWAEGRPPCPPIKQTLPDRLALYGESLGLTPVQGHQ
jgi:uncharacterized protein